MARIFERKEGVIPFVASTQQSLELSRNYHMTKLLLKLKVNHTNNGAKFLNNTISGIVNNIQVVANGDENLKQIPFSKLEIDTVRNNGQKITTVNTVDGTYDSFIYVEINFNAPNMLRPYDTILNTALYQTFNLVIDWASASSMGTGITVNSASIEVHSSSLIGYVRNQGETIKHFKETSLVEEITASSVEKEIKLPVNKMYKSLTIVSSLDGEKVDNIINRVILKSGTTVICDIDAHALRSENIFAIRPVKQDDLKGVYIIDLVQRGKFSDLLSTMQNFNTLELVLDVTKQAGTNRVQVLSDTIDMTSIVENS
jgi:hypothetical protein